MNKVNCKLVSLLAALFASSAATAAPSSIAVRDAGDVVLGDKMGDVLEVTVKLKAPAPQGGESVIVRLPYGTRYSSDWLLDGNAGWSLFVPAGRREASLRLTTIRQDFSTCLGFAAFGDGQWVFSSDVQLPSRQGRLDYATCGD